VALVPLEIPKVGLVMESARLVRWLKKVGERVQQGEPLLELETEKSVVEIESTASGRLAQILLEVDQEARVGDRVAWVEVEDVRGATSADAPQATGGAARASATAGPGASKLDGPDRGASPQLATATPANQQLHSGRVRSSPVARRLAAEHALDLRRITGSGPRGRVQLADVRRAIDTGRVNSQPLSSMRRAIARSMTLSNATVPQFNVERAVDWTSVHRMRARFATELPADAPKPSVNDFLLQGIARTLLSFPALNATFSGDPNSPEANVLPAKGTHVGLVVSVENGLLVPVFHDVEQLGLLELARRRVATVARALQGKLKREELEGATFSVSNLGARGPDRFTALISPPQSALLAVGRQRDCVIANNGELLVRPLSQLTLTVDHRVADGRLASDFLACLVEALEGDGWQLN
jgi:pyruvate dehydrogenase E2 component (dihydrolipoamide acetyltransferase)